MNISEAIKTAGPLLLYGVVLAVVVGGGLYAFAGSPASIHQAAPENVASAPSRTAPIDSTPTSEITLLNQEITRQTPLLAATMNVFKLRDKSDFLLSGKSFSDWGKACRSMLDVYLSYRQLASQAFERGDQGEAESRSKQANSSLREGVAYCQSSAQNICRQEVGQSKLENIAMSIRPVLVDACQAVAM